MSQTTHLLKNANSVFKHYIDNPLLVKNALTFGAFLIHNQ